VTIEFGKKISTRSRKSGKRRKKNRPWWFHERLSPKIVYPKCAASEGAANVSYYRATFPEALFKSQIQVFSHAWQ
jgi:hypothetical protein